MKWMSNRLVYADAVMSWFVRNVAFVNLTAGVTAANLNHLPHVVTNATVVDTASSNPAQLAGLAPVRELRNDNPAKRIENL
jgi:hypothetical protein